MTKEHEDDLINMLTYIQKRIEQKEITYNSSRRGIWVAALVGVEYYIEDILTEREIKYKTRDYEVKR